MKKKVLSLLLVLAMAFSMIPMASATVNTNYGLVTGVAIGAPESTIYNTDNPGSDAWHTRGNKTITSVDEFANWVITNRDYDAGTSGDVTLGADLDFEGATVEVPRNSNTILFDGHKIQNARFVFPMTPGSIDVKDAANFENCSFEGGTGDEEAGFVRARSSGVFTNCYFAGTSGNVFIARNAPSSVTCVNCLFDRGSSPAFAVGRSEVTGPIALSHCVIRGASRACVLLDDAYVRTTSKTTGSVTLDKCLMIGARELGSDQGVGKNVTVTNGNLTSDIMIVSCVPEASTTDIQINNSPAVTYNTANAVDNYGVISGDSGVPAEATGYGLITGVAIGAPGSTIYNTDNPGSGAWYTRGNKTINSVDEFANWVITNRDYDNATASDVTLGANLDFKGATVEVPRNSYAFNFNGHRIQNARFVFQVAQNSSIDVKDAANFENCSFEGGQGYSETGFVRARSSGVFTNCYFVGTSGNVFIGRNKPSSVTCVNCLFDRGASPAYAVSGGGVDGTIALTHCVIRGSTRACVFTDSANVETTDAGVGNVTLEKCLMIGTRALGSDQGVGRNITVSNGNLTSDIMIVSCVAGASTTDVQINDSPAVTYNTANAVDNYGVISGDVVSETYTVTWKSQDGATTYETDAEVAENAAPSYDGDAPTKDADAEYTYTFAGWATTMNAESGTSVAALPVVTADVTYYAAFSKTVEATNYGLITGVAIGAPESTTVYNTDNPGSDAWYTRGDKTITSVAEFANWVITNRDCGNATASDVTLGADLDFEGATVEVPRNSYAFNFNGHRIQNARFVFQVAQNSSIDVKDAANFENCSFEGGQGYSETGFVRARSSGVFTNCYFVGTSGNVFIGRNAPGSVTCVNCLFDRGASPAFAIGNVSVAGTIALSHCVIRGSTRACVFTDSANVETTDAGVGSVTLDKCLMIGTRALGSDQGVGRNVTVSNGNLTSDIMIVSCVAGASTTDVQINDSPAVTYNTANAVDNYGVISGDVVVSETYTVTWKSQDGATTYETDAEVAENAAPSYDGDAPTKDADAEYTYTFAGWATTMNAESGTAVEALPAVTADVTYYAAFSKTAKPVVPAAGDEAAATQLTGLTFAIAEADAAGDVPEAYDAEYSYFFEITATTGNVTAFDADENSWATVTMAFDDVANLGNYTLARWDDTEGWVFTGLRNLDAGATAGTVTFQTNHLSGFGLLTSTPDQPHYYATVALRGEAADLLDEAAETEAGIDRHVDDNDQPINDLKVGDEITITVHPSIDIDGSWIYVKWDSDFLTLTNAPAGWVRMTSASGHQMDSDATSMEYYALETISLLKDAGDSMGDFEFTVAAPATVSDADLPIEIPFQFFGSPVALTGTSYAGSHIDMLYTDTLVRLSDLAIDYVVEVVQYGANTAQILVYSKTAGTFTYDDADVLSVTNKAFLDVTGAGYIYRSTYANLAEQANEFYGTTEIPTTAPADVYVYSWIVNGNRLLTASAQSIIDDNHKDIEAYVATKLTFSSEVQTENIRYTNESDVNGDGKINLHDKEAVRQMMEGSGSATVAEEATNAADRTAVLTARYDDILANNQRVALRCDFDRTAGNEKFVDEAVEYAVYEGIYLN